MEIIKSIEEVEMGKGYETWAGYKITTSKQEILLIIDDEQSCCETWGYLLSEDDTEKFIGVNLRGIKTVDVNRTNKIFFQYSGSGRDVVVGSDTDVKLDYHNDDHIDTYEGDVIFVDIETSRGTLQFVAYNGHNGYYGHTVKIKSTQLTEERTL